ncbi:MAG: hypothetical protein ACRDT5_21210 [Mycobacterium sp.]
MAPRTLTVAAVAATLTGVTVLTAPPAAAAPTCTSGDLQTRVGYQCSLAPGLGVTPGSSCVWLPGDSRNPFVVRSQWPAAGVLATANILGH